MTTTTLVALLIGTHLIAAAVGMAVVNRIRGRRIRATGDELAVARVVGVDRTQDRGAGMGLVLFVIAVVAVLVALVASLLSQALAPLQDRYPCPTPTAATCPDGPGTSS